MFMLIYCRVLRLFRTGIIDLGSHALQCNTVLSCAERTPLKSTCCHALQCNTVLSCITMPARCDGITKQSRFTIPMTMCCHALQCNTVLSCFTMQHGAVMHYNASTMRRHHQTVAVYNTYDYVVKHERNTVLLCGNRSTTYYVLFSHRATCC